MTNHPGEIPPSVDALVAQFEEEWLDGKRPDIGDYLSTAGPHRLSLLVELVHIDLEFRLKSAEPARVEDYLSRFPELPPQAIVGLRDAEELFRARPEQTRTPSELASTLASTEFELDSPPLPEVPGFRILGVLGKGGMGIVTEPSIARLGAKWPSR